MFVVKNGLMSLGSLLLLDWFVVELVLMGYCLYDVFYKPSLLPPKHTLTFMSQQSDASALKPIVTVQTPVEYMIDTEYLVFTCFDALPPCDTKAHKAGASADTLKIYDFDSIDLKPDMGDAYPDTIRMK